jgi:nitroreductase
MDLATVDHLLTTTRSVRKRLDFSRPVEPEVIQKCIEIALQAPTGANQQGWRVLVITDEAKRKAIADLYLGAFKQYANPENPMVELPPEGDIRLEQLPRVLASAMYLAEHFHEAPVQVMFCIEGRIEKAPVVGQASVYGSILPAAWSFMLAARARGLGSAWTTLHLMHEQEVAELLGIPDTITQAVLLPVAYFIGPDFKPARRVPATELTYWNTWGASAIDTSRRS